MSNCCKTSNPLRRDGTSQKQRFPLALAESYVKIDERSHADILNFIQQLAKEFNYYGADNVIDGDWEDFFSEDLSFVLAQTLKTDVAAYRATFMALLNAAKEELEANNFAASFLEMQFVFDFFLNPTPSVLAPSELLEPIPLMISRWIDLLPESELFVSNDAFSFRDLVSDGRYRLFPVAKKLEKAHMEVDVQNGTSSTSDWLFLASNGWDLSSVNLVNSDYLSAPPEAEELANVIELLKASFDTFAGMLDNFQAQVPAYLLQSLEEFPWHNPQNALLLAFVRQLDHARDHLNTLTRKHLLYEYMDVLKFNKRPLTPDQAVVIMQLRKGTDRFLLGEGTLLKAGKDVDGNAMAYAVDNEVVVNQAQISEMMNVHVERDNADAIVGVYASPVANSLDGLGAELPQNDPKWNLFGEAQLAKLPQERTMPDARLGFAIASPLFNMKEGSRTIDATFMVKLTDLPDISTADKKERVAANIRNAFKATYTSEKEWTPAKIANVHLIENQAEVDSLGLGPAIVDVDTVVLNFRVVLDEGDAPFVIYNEKSHQEKLVTPWPVLKLSLQGQSDDYSAGTFAPPAFTNAGVVAGGLALFAGNLYKNNTTSTQTTLAGLTLYDDIEALWEGVAFDPETDYLVGSYMMFSGGVYTPVNDIIQTGFGEKNQNPEDFPSRWTRVFRTYMYDDLHKLDPSQLHLKVDVKGAFGLLYENDFGKLKGEKPFPMFGGTPVIGSRFYIGSQEIFGKHLEDLEIEIIWQDPPDNLGNYYKKYDPITVAAQSANTNSGGTCGVDCNCCPPGYYTEGKDMQVSWKPDSKPVEEAYPVCYESCPSTSGLLSNSNWLADISFLYDGQWEYLDRKPLFYQDSNGNGAQEKHTIAFPSQKFDPFERDLRLSEHERLESNTPRGFIRFELATPYIAFGHKYYRDLYVDAVTSAVKYDLANVDTPNEPYTPVVKEIRLNYVSKSTIHFEDEYGIDANYQSRVDQYFHLHPFGQTEVHPFLQAEGNVPMLAQYLDEGYLYLGIENLPTPSTLSVLFQLAEGSGDSDIEIFAPTWSVLCENNWTDLQRRDILLDTTDELITSGVIQYDFDASFQARNTLLDAPLRWLRIKVEENTPAYMKAIDIIPQAVLVSFFDQDNNPEHLMKALPAGTISALVESDSALKKVSQPYGSYGGKLPEEGETFLTRVSERLRHKQRSINVWDYERMVLEEFPSIYKVKCLNHTEFRAEHTNFRDWEISPGFVTVVCIPDLRNLNSVNPFEPKASIRTINNVQKFLSRHVSSWVDLKVKNPLYEEIKINCEIGFMPGRDPGYYTRQLETAIQEFLSPWAFDHDREIVFGGKIHQSKLIQFIEQQDYVDFIVHFEMDHIINDETRSNVLEAVATTGRSILVSSLNHVIESTKPDCSICVPSEEIVGDTGCCNPDGSSN